jgi:hypothetical protein
MIHLSQSRFSGCTSNKEEGREKSREKEADCRYEQYEAAQ